MPAEVQNYIRAEPLNLNKQAVFDLAESVAEDLGYEPGGDIHAVVRELGGRVVVEDGLLTDPEHTGSLYVDAPGKFRIVIPSHTSSARDRFTIAHELGHYFLHYLMRYDDDEIRNVSVIAYRKDSDRIEWEANWFAAAFLMPGAAFRRKYKRAAGDVDVLSRSFGVSRAAVAVRAQDLGLVG